MSEGKKLFALVVGAALLGLFIAIQMKQLGLDKLDPKVRLHSFNLPQVLPNHKKPQLKNFNQSFPSQKPVILNFWASWCAPCETEKPFLKTLLKNPSSSLITIASRDSEALARKSNKRSLENYIVVLDKDGLISRSVGVTQLPQTVLVDTRGIVKHRVREPLNDKSVKELIRAANEWVPK